jgi:ligand-binding SRPBCC domain-containing protein
MIHTLNAQQDLPCSLEQAWDFFSNPRNLARITPPEIGFEITTPDLPERIYPGMMIQYRVRPLLGIPMTWLSEITFLEHQRYFIDEQRIGPYAIWHHEHGFRAKADGTVTLEDRITYTLPFSPLGDIVHPWLVRPQLQRIFAYRKEITEQLFAKR